MLTDLSSAQERGPQLSVFPIKTAATSVGGLEKKSAFPSTGDFMVCCCSNNTQVRLVVLGPSLWLHLMKYRFHQQNQQCLLGKQGVFVPVQCSLGESLILII